MSTAAPQTRPDRRATPSGLGVHLVALALVLLAGFALVGPGTSFSADEGAVIAQVRLVAEGSWTTPHPVPAVDPDGRWFPLESSLRADDGFAPYAKHPVYPLLLVPFDALAGVHGMVLLSVVGTWCAALCGALVAHRLDARAAVPVLWVLGVGSPLLFNGYLVIAHTIAAALCGAAAWLLVRLDLGDGLRAWIRLAVAAGALLLAVTLRSEAVLLAGGLAVGVFIGSAQGLVRRGAVALGIAGAGALGYLLDGRLNQVVIGSTGVEPFRISHSEGFLEGRIDGFLISWWRPSLAAELTLDQALLLVTVAAALAVGVVLRRRGDAELLQVLAGALAVLAVVRFVLEPAPLVPGLLPAFPLVAAALPLAWPAARGPRRILVVAFAVFALAVLATQYSSAGSSQWGARYLVVGLPVVVPVLVVSLIERWRERERAVQIALAGATVVVLGALAVGALLGMREIHAGTAAVAERVRQEGIAATPEPPVVIATRAAIPRLLHDQLDDARWLLVPPEDLELALGRLADAGEQRVSLVGPMEHLDAADDLSGYAVVAEVQGTSPAATAVRRLALDVG